jgi:predicted O-linked N-acetylglucosamine transferase (SPINDLY family)
MDLLGEGLQHHRAGRFSEAQRLYREVLAQDPDHSQAVFLLGVLATASGRLDEAVEMLTRATTLAPGQAACHAELGEAYRRRGDSSAAIDSLLKAIAIDPGPAGPVCALGDLLRERGATDGALACYERASELHPDLPDITARLTTTRAAMGLRDAVTNDRPGTTPEDALSAATLLALARPVAVSGRLQDAATMLERAVHLNPRLTVAHCNLGVVNATLGRVHEACANYRAALEIEPGLADTHHNLGNALLRGGLVGEAISSFRNAVKADPDRASHHSDLVFHLHFDPAYDSRALLAEARGWERAHAVGLAGPPDRRERDRAPERRLRIGYVSPNFRRHCQAFFMCPLLENHDHEHFEIFCYSDAARTDDWTDRLLARADRAQTVTGMSDAALAERIVDDGIDILVDLTMHMAENRLGTFARRPAPIQVCWLAYPGTTGLSAIDYRVTDPYLDPPESDVDAYAERPLRLPETFWCYDPLTSEAVGPLPARQRGHVGFGSLNNVLKVSHASIALWAQVLRRVENSTITLLAPVGDARGKTLDHFEEEGIERGRVRLVEYQSRQLYLATYRAIDIGLDTVPYNGHTTSLDALWMGVPVVTLVGSTVVGRAGLCHAMNLGLPELVARTPEQFVSIAAGLAEDIDRLSFLRAGLRARMERSPLMDGARFARNMEAAYRSIWRRS